MTRRAQKKEDDRKLQTRRSSMRLRGIVCPDESRLVLPPGVFRLTESKSTISTHTLNCADFLDSFLKSEHMRE